LILPRILGVEEYGYYQLYLFYLSFVGFLHLGWCDGVYLKYGGIQYETLDKKAFKGQYILFILFQFLVSILFLFVFLIFLKSSSEKNIVIISVLFNILIVNGRNYLLLIMQATNRMKDYSFSVIFDRLIFMVLSFLLILFGFKDFQFFIFADIVGKIISFIWTATTLKEMTFNLTGKYVLNLKETFENILIGSSLMFANIASTLIIGIIRFGIQIRWSVVFFGKVSLALSISNILMIFINAISLGIFPLLKKIDSHIYKKAYFILKFLLLPLMFIVLTLFFPISFLLVHWLPNYKESIDYMAILFPIIVFESKVGLLTNTFFKALRKEKIIFKVNVLTAILSFIVTFFTCYILGDLTSTIYGIVFLLGFRSTISEIYISKIFGIKIAKDLFIEILMVLIFILCNHFYSGINGFLMYIFFVLIYILLNINNLRNVLKFSREIFLNSEI